MVLYHLERSKSEIEEIIFKVLNLSYHLLKYGSFKNIAFHKDFAKSLIQILQIEAN
jgi:hypothetical protein